MRERRTGGPSGRTLKHAVVFVPDNALVAAQADPRGAVDPLIPLRNRGERGSTPAGSAPPGAPAPGPSGGGSKDWPEHYQAG